MSDAPLIHCVVPLAKRVPPVLGVGAFLKNALCLIQGNEAWISRENGSLDSAEAIHRFEATAQGLLALAHENPIVVAHDLHPDFPCTRWAVESGLRTVAVQHHHAHAAAVMAEHEIAHPILALTLDGFGLGENNEAWGGELLHVRPDGFTRLGHLLMLHQAGGDVAARQPWRMGAAALWAMGRGDEIASRYSAFAGAAQLAVMMERGLNAPLTSSAGRLFDAACGLLDVMPVASFEGEAPMTLESLAAQRQGAPLVDQEGWRVEAAGLILDMRPLLVRLADSKAEGLAIEDAASLFHGTLASALVDWTKRAAARVGVREVALCGGCFLNAILRSLVVQGLTDAGLTPLLPKQLPVGDTAIALGQVYAAALTLDEQ